MFAVLVIGALALQVWVWRTLAERVRSRRLNPGKAIARYAGAALLPIAGLAIVLFSLVGLEEWLGIAVLSEPFSRATPIAALLLIAIFAIGSLAFAVWCAYLWTSRRQEPRS